MQQRPDLNQLQKLVIPKIANKWDSIAIQLDFDAVQISNIEENHQELPVERSCQKMLWGWLDSSSNNSNHAKDLIQAVKDVEYICYAEELKTGFKFIIITSTSDLQPSTTIANQLLSVVMDLSAHPKHKSCITKNNKC